MKLHQITILTIASLLLAACATNPKEQTHTNEAKTVEYAFFVIENESFESSTGYPVDSPGFSPTGRSGVSELLFEAIEKENIQPAIKRSVALGASPNEDTELEGQKELETIEILSISGNLTANSVENNAVKITCKLRCSYKDSTNEALSGAGPVWPGSTFYLNTDFRSELMRVAGNEHESIFFIARLNPNS
jgi:hypothetical protein